MDHKHLSTIFSAYNLKLLIVLWIFLIYLLLCYCFLQKQRTIISFRFYGTKWPLCADVPLSNHSIKTIAAAAAVEEEEEEAAAAATTTVAEEELNSSSIAQSAGP